MILRNISYQNTTWRHNAEDFDLKIRPEDGGNTVLRNTGILPHYTASNPEDLELYLHRRESLIPPK